MQTRKKTKITISILFILKRVYNSLHGNAEKKYKPWLGARNKHMKAYHQAFTRIVWVTEWRLSKFGEMI
jgi:hypothetical protein